jgi:YbbR domain-containing protein
MPAIWPFRHFGLKLVSVGLALSLWMAVAGEETVERGLRVPLELQQFPAGLELQGEPPTTVDVRVRGASGTMSRLSTGDVVAVLDLRAAHVGRRLFPITPEQVRVPFGVEVVQVTPATVTMVFESSASGQVPINPAVEGKPAPGYVVGRIRVDPPVIEIVGPETAVRHAASALTEPVSVVGARESITELVTVGLIDPALRLKTPRPVSVSVQIVPASGERTLRDLPVHLRNLSTAFSAEAVPSIVHVSVRGTREAVSVLRADDVAAYVDLAGLGSGVYSLTVRADVSGDAGVTRVEPPTVQVRITRARD